MPGSHWGSHTGSLVNDVITEAPESSLSEKAGALHVKMGSCRVPGRQRQKCSTQGSLEGTEHLEQHPLPDGQRIQEFPSSTSTGKRRLLFAFGWGENGQQQNGSAVAWQRCLPVTVTNQ